MMSAARRNVASAPRKHHIVPQSYLAAWATSGRVRVTDISSRRSWTTSPAKALRRTDFYRLEHEDIPEAEIPPLLYETMLSRVEGEALPGLTALAADVPEGDRVQYRYPPDVIVPVIDFLAFQATRGQRHRQTLISAATDGYRQLYAPLVDRELLRVELAERLGRQPTATELDESHTFMLGLLDGSIEVGPAEAAATVEGGLSAQRIRDFIGDRNWRVYQASRPLMTCDEPVLILGGPGTPRSEVAGFANAGALVFPLAPHALLAMFRNDLRLSPEGQSAQLSPLEVHQLNREIMAASAEAVVETSDGVVASRLVVPPWPRVTAVEEGYTMADEPETEVVRFFRRTRWANTSEKPPWPVPRWWHLAGPDLRFTPPPRATWSIYDAHSS